MSIIINNSVFDDKVVLDAIKAKLKGYQTEHKRVLSKQVEIKRSYENQMDGLKTEIEKLANKKHELEEAVRIMEKATAGG